MKQRNASRISLYGPFWLELRVGLMKPGRAGAFRFQTYPKESDCIIVGIIILPPGKLNEVTLIHEMVHAVERTSVLASRFKIYPRPLTCDLWLRGKLLLEELRCYLMAERYHQVRSEFIALLRHCSKSAKANNP